MRYVGSAILLAWVCATGVCATGVYATTAALAADRAVHLEVPSPVRKDIAAMPRIADPADDAERRINTALKHLDLNVLKASRNCQGGDWTRSVDVPMSGPAFLSLTITDSVNCDGNAHPDSGTFSIVYDLASGSPVDWTRLLPASLTGTMALEEQGDGTKVVTLASKRLFQLYMAGYRAGDAQSSDLEECKQALLGEATDGPPGMMVWLDAKAGGLAVQVGLAHVEKACEEPVIIPAAALRAEGAQPALLKAFDTQPHK